MPERQVPSLGTGFVISPDGYIVTNDHVVRDVEKIEVHFEDGAKVEAEIVGRDSKTDIALIKIETDRSLPSLSLGDSDDVRPGDWVVAIGNPFGLEHTVTAGIVSAKHRVINTDPDPRRFDDFIQTDAAINPGNSGGPLINLRGEVIGINTAINPRANTIGFAVPINQAKQILPQLRTTGRVTRGWLGVYIQSIDEDTAELLGLATREGALVSKVEPGGPADAAGIQRGDVIVEFDGRPIAEMDELPRAVAGAAVGSTAEVVVLRKGRRKSLRVQLGELATGERLARAGGSPAPEKSALGLRVQDLSPEIAEQLGLDDTRGVVVTGVEPGSAAAEAGLRRGDVILEVNQQAVGDTAAFAGAVGDGGKGALLLVRRGNAEVFVAVKKSTG
jgi:serine protease Do